MVGDDCDGSRSRAAADTRTNRRGCLYPARGELLPTNQRSPYSPRPAHALRGLPQFLNLLLDSLLQCHVLIQRTRNQVEALDLHAVALDGLGHFLIRFLL